MAEANHRRGATASAKRRKKQAQHLSELEETCPQSRTHAARQSKSNIHGDGCQVRPLWITCHRQDSQQSAYPQSLRATCNIATDYAAAFVVSSHKQWAGVLRKGAKRGIWSMWQNQASN
eukprot:5845407-Pleurochrysis_carterae.AAC.1